MSFCIVMPFHLAIFVLDLSVIGYFNLESAVLQSLISMPKPIFIVVAGNA